MKTKIFTLCFALVASVGTMFAESGTCGENLTWDLTDGVLTISGTGIMTDYKLTEGGASDAPWYSCRETITTVNITSGVTSIGQWAFYYCPSLISVTIGNSVTSIGENAFYYCPSLTFVDIPNGVTSIGDYAFVACAGLTSVTIGNSVTSIGNTAFAECSGLTSVTIPNSVTSIGEYAFYGCTSLTSVTIPNSVTSIGDGAFGGCSGLTSVTIGNHVSNIGLAAFAGCKYLKAIISQATTPPSLGGEAFDYTVDKSIPLYVPVGSISAYQSADKWKEFTNILPIAAKDTETTTVTAEPITNSVEITWPVVEGAYTYEIVIKDKSGNVVCTLVFNAQGQLISIAFNAPGRDGAPQQTHGAGFSFVVNGLDSGTEYSYDIVAKDENGSVLDTKSGSFTTQAPQGIDDINAATKSQKILRDNQVLILRGDKTYTITGQEIK